jgi:hypothetical protein
MGTDGSVDQEAYRCPECGCTIRTHSLDTVAEQSVILARIAATSLAHRLHTVTDDTIIAVGIRDTVDARSVDRITHLI